MLVICTKCNRTHMGVSRKYAVKEVESFNAYFDTLTKEKQDDYYGGKKSSLDNYKCYCGNTSFKPGSTAPEGCTIGPVIYEVNS